MYKPSVDSAIFSKMNIKALDRPQIIISLLVFSVLIRFIFLTADFPLNITGSAALYGDEGYKSSGSINHFLTSEWYLEGDFNPVVILPVFHLVQRGVFSLLGMNLASARVSNLLFTSGIFFLLYYWLSKRKWSGSLFTTFLILGFNFHLFIYSRVAFIEVPMIFFVLLSLVFADQEINTHKSIARRVVFSSVFYLIAYLTKTSAIFALPLLIFVLYRTIPNRKEKIRAIIVFLFITGVVLFTYYGYIFTYYQEDYRFFKDINFQKRIVNPFSFDALFYLYYTINNAKKIDNLLWPLLAIILIFYSIYRRKFSFPDMLMLLWAAFYSGLLAFSSYHPTRYFLPLVIPMAVILGYFVVQLCDLWGRSLKFKAIYGLIIFTILTSTFINIWRISAYLANPKYTLHQVGQEIGKRVREDGGNLLIGDIAKTISIITAIPSLNASLGTKTFEWKLEKYNPSHLISLGEPDFVLDPSRLRLLEKYDAFGNYYYHRRIHLYKIIPPEND